MMMMYSLKYIVTDSFYVPIIRDLKNIEEITDENKNFQ